MRDLIPSTTRITLSVGPTAALDVPSLLGQLDRYPYGCAEQTTSRALPLLYVNDMAKRLGLASEAEIRERIQKAIERVFEMQDASGAFGIWGPADGDLWLTAYVTDFLTRAKETGYTRAPAAVQSGARQARELPRLRAGLREGRRGARLCALRARPQRPRADRRSALLRRHAPRALLDAAGAGAARRRASPCSATRSAPSGPSRRRSPSIDGAAGQARDLARADYGSFVRDGAGRADARVRDRRGQGGAAKPRQRARQGLSGARSYTSTQEQAWMLLAARALAEQARDTRARRSTARRTQGELTRRVPAAELDQRAADDRQRRRSAVDAVVTVLGASLTPEPAVAKGFTHRAQPTTRSTARRSTWRAPTAARRRSPQNERLVVVRQDRGRGRGRPRAAGRPAAGRPRDREPAPRRQRRPEGPRLAEARARARAHRVPRRPLRCRLRLLRRRAAVAAATGTVDSGHGDASPTSCAP